MADSNYRDSGVKIFYDISNSKMVSADGKKNFPDTGI